MTMQHQIHPDDERLSALAGGDPEATDDAALRGHVESCERCTGAVQDLARLRAVLAELPDLAPSRPLQLIPPAPAESAPRASWLRRVAAPVMAAGAGLAIVGAVGLSVSVLGGMAASGAAPLEAPADQANGGAEGAPVSPAVRVADGQSPVLEPHDRGAVAGASPDEAEFEDTGGYRGPSDDSGNAPALLLQGPGPWVMALLLGGVLFLVGLIARFAVRPRAG